jgi:hypothetical protein
VLSILAAVHLVVLRVAPMAPQRMVLARLQ